MKKLFALIILFVMCGGLVSAQSARASDDSCFPHKTLYTTAPIEIRSSDSRFASSLGRTVTRKTYTVFDSKRDWLFNSSCWIKIQGGWLLRRPTGSAIRPGTTTSTSTSTRSTTTTSKCYTASKAYITGAMNIRSDPSISKNKVGSANAGESFSVSSSQRNGDYCWLKISKGWIAKTGRVQATKPTVSTTRTSSTTSCNRHPSILSDSSGRIKRAIDYLCRHAPSWYNYVVSKTSTVQANSGLVGGRAYVRRRHIEISPRAYPNTMEMSSVIVHEACHIYQWEEGRYNGLAPREREVECIQKMIDYVVYVAPGSRWLGILRDYIKNPQVGHG